MMTATSLQHHVHRPQNVAQSTVENKLGDEGLAAPPSLGNGQPNSSMSSDSVCSHSPEPVTSTAVPNPIAQTSPSNFNSQGMTSINWSQHQTSAPLPLQTLSSHSSSAPNSCQPNQPMSNGMHGTGTDMAMSTEGVFRHKEISDQPQLSTTSPAPSSMRRYNNSSDGSPESKGGLTNRRQKRLERNRESARLSRRRRKQYLEVLEERVNNLSVEMDMGRRHHVAVAVDTLKEMKRKALEDPSGLHAVEHILVSTGSELRVASTFLTQQIRSLSFPPHIKFLLWLSLQNDNYFRGGRAASERLSAARIGERMLSSGNDRVPPSHGMWPLFCNEVGLSYDQEEKVRAFQKSLLLVHESWLDRHAASASNLVVESAHDCIQSFALNIGQRQTSITSGLDPDQRRKFLSWANQNVDRIKGTTDKEVKPIQDGYNIQGEQHDAANLYILNNRLQRILSSMDSPPPLVTGPTLKKLSRRPSFESLGNHEKNDEAGMSRESSFPSCGSLKRSASELSVSDEDRVQIQMIPPEEAEAAAKPTIDSVLGFVKHMIPEPRMPPPPLATPGPVFSAPPPPVKSNTAITTQEFVPMQYSSGQESMQHIMPNNVYAPPIQQHQLVPQPLPEPAPVHIHQGQLHHPGQLVDPHPPIPAFLPPHLNVVPEESFLPGNADPDDFLFDLAEEDWAIGEGFAMDAT